MSYSFIVGLVGSLILIVGAAWPELKSSQNSRKSIKNWLLAIGGDFMLIYSILNYVQGGSIFFVFLQVLVFIASIFMMLNMDDKISGSIITLSGISLIVWSLFLFNGYSTIILILGLGGIGLGYVFKMGTMRRNIALTFGSALIALFSYFEANWIFFWLNIFFAIFSGYYLFKGLSHTPKFPRKT